MLVSVNSVAFPVRVFLMIQVALSIPISFCTCSGSVSNDAIILNRPNSLVSLVDSLHLLR